MKTLLQINVTANWGSTGKIAEEIGKLAIENGFESWMGYGRGNPTSNSNLIRIGNNFDMRCHGVQTRFFDNHGLSSKKVTKDFIEKIKDIKPDIIHLHNIHGYYVNYKILFEYLKEWGGPVVWTLHDCWTFTGHCAYYTFAKCNKWKIQCKNCPQIKSYPASLWKDRSEKNFIDKKIFFSSLQNLVLVPVSQWLAEELSNSFLNNYPIKTIQNGIDLNTFKPSKKIKDNDKEFNILGVASIWEKRKGLEEFIKLRSLLPENYRITLVGLNKKQVNLLPRGIKGISRTDNVEQLVRLYNKADVFVNPTLEDNFPTTNLEALACGTPVITYNTGGSPETIDAKTGIVVPYREIDNLANQIKYVTERNPFSRIDCRQRAELHFNKDNAFQKYIDLYTSILKS